MNVFAINLIYSLVGPSILGSWKLKTSKNKSTYFFSFNLSINFLKFSSSSFAVSPQPAVSINSNWKTSLLIFLLKSTHWDSAVCESNPDETLNARETTKKGGTGLGLWFAREAATRNAGQLHVIPVENGYMLRATWTK